MTVNELYEAWLFNAKPDTKIKIWDKSIEDYAYIIDFNSKEFSLTKEQTQELENTKVLSFTVFYNRPYDVLLIIVNKLGVKV